MSEAQRPPERRDRVGPNAILRVMESLEACSGRDAVVQLMQTAGLESYLAVPPDEMVDEREVTRLHQAMRATLGVEQARALAQDAGRRTAEYLLAVRIPKPAQFILKRLPSRLAARALLKAIGANAWTFVGTGVFSAKAGYPPRLTVEDSLLCRDTHCDQPLCDFYAGTYQRLFRELVAARAEVVEIACHAQGAERCVFEVRW